MDLYHPFLYPTPNGEGLDFDEASRAKHQLQIEFPCAMDTKSATRILVSAVKKVPPLGNQMRDLLVKAYSRQSCLKETLLNASQQDCVVRVYLRELSMVRHVLAARGPKLSVHDFPLYLERASDLLDIHDMSARMGTVLAFLHWGIGSSGEGARFALGGFTQTPPSDPASDLRQIRDRTMIKNNSQTRIQFYVDSFSRLEPRWGLKTLPSMKDAVYAYLDNPSFPRPDSEVFSKGVEHEDLWTIFAKKYVDTSARLGHALAGIKFITAIEYKVVPTRFKYDMQSFSSNNIGPYKTEKRHEADFWSSAVVLHEQQSDDLAAAHSCDVPFYVCTERKLASVMDLLPQ